MELHRGRLIDHVHLRAEDLAASKRFYAAIFDALGIPYGAAGRPAVASSDRIIPLLVPKSGG